MCGLVGIAGDTTGNWKEVFTELLLIDSVRGAHSTGAGTVGRANLDYKLAKEPGHPYNLFHKKEFEDLMSVNNASKVFMGHNRYATIGEHSEGNAHPFAFDQVMGMHNGTLDKWIIKDLHEHASYGTDSEAIMSSINEWGVAETAKKMLGAWALVWFDKRDDTLNFLRNDKRPLHYCYSEDRNTLIWASEVEMIQYILGRKGKKSRDNEFWTTTKDTHYSWKVPQAMNKPFDAPAQTKVEGKSYTYYAGVPFKQASGKGHTAHTTNTQTKTFAGSKKRSNILPFHQKFDTTRFRPPYKDMYGHTIGKKEFEEMVTQGCAFCSDNTIKWLEFVQIMGPWVGAKQTPFMCEVCYGDTDAYACLEYAM